MKTAEDIQSHLYHYSSTAEARQKQNNRQVPGKVEAVVMTPVAAAAAAAAAVVASRCTHEWPCTRRVKNWSDRPVLRRQTQSKQAMPAETSWHYFNAVCAESRITELMDYFDSSKKTEKISNLLTTSVDDLRVKSDVYHNGSTTYCRFPIILPPGVSATRCPTIS